MPENTQYAEIRRIVDPRRTHPCIRPLCRIPFKQTKAANPLVRELASILRRSPAAVARKLGNFGAFDPELHGRGISGLTHFSRLDKQVWDEFHDDWGNLVYEAYKLKESFGAGFDAIGR